MISGFFHASRRFIFPVARLWIWSRDAWSGSLEYKADWEKIPLIKQIIWVCERILVIYWRGPAASVIMYMLRILSSCFFIFVNYFVKFDSNRTPSFKAFLWVSRSNKFIKHEIKLQRSEVLNLLWTKNLMHSDSSLKHSENGYHTELQLSL